MAFEFDAALIGVIITGLMALLALAYGYGVLSNRVKGNSRDIEKQETAHKEIMSQIRCEFKAYQLNNREDHSMIFQKLDKILLNGKGNEH